MRHSACHWNYRPCHPQPTPTTGCLGWLNCRLAYQAFLCFIYTMSYLIVLSIAKQKGKGLEKRLQNAEKKIYALTPLSRLQINILVRLGLKAATYTKLEIRQSVNILDE